jgi:hypothetical protein
MMQRRPESLSPAILAQIVALSQDDQEYQYDVQQQRDYYAGRQFIQLTERLRAFLGGQIGVTDKDFKRIRLNIFRTVVNAVVERLIVAKVVTDEPGIEEPLKDEFGRVVTGADGLPQAGVVKPTANWAGRTWLHNRMDARQRGMYMTTLRDSESFVLVTWDNDASVARFVPHPRYILSSAGGDGYGCTAAYQNNDPEQPLLFVTKRWTETTYPNGSRLDIERLTIYFPDRIEKYSGMDGAWSPFRDAGDSAWPLPWTHPKTGAPLGIPIVHLRSTAGFEAGEAIGPQNAINKTMIDLLAAADLTAFQILIAMGWEPVDSDGNPLPIEPGTWIGTTNPDGKAVVIPGANLTNISEQVYNWIQWAAMATDTPASRFTMSRQVAAEGTLKEQNVSLLNKCRMRQGELGIGVADMFVIARGLHNAFFSAPALDEDVTISVEWEPIESRDEDAELARAVLKVDKLAIPLAQVWSELGYTEVQIAQWEAARSLAAQASAEALAAAQASALASQGQGQSQNGTREPQNGTAPAQALP